MKKFFKNAEAGAVEGGFTVLLDGRAIRTPAKTAFVVPTEALAAAIAEEWAGQGEELDGPHSGDRQPARARPHQVAQERGDDRPMAPRQWQGALRHQRRSRPKAKHRRHQSQGGCAPH